jgi:hypothetical protein
MIDSVHIEAGDRAPGRPKPGTIPSGDRSGYTTSEGQS